jgi:oligopeptide/dipeptide ABC transporter ATP-binding protein
VTQPRDSLLLQVKNLKTHFNLDQGVVRAVNGVTFSLNRGQTVGVVGESGCGKSMMVRSLLRIVPKPGKIVEGEILYSRADNRDGTGLIETVDLAKLDPMGSEIRQIRGAEIAMIFQEPMTSLSPVHTIADQISEVILLHQNVSPNRAEELVIEMLSRVGMADPSVTMNRYPHQLSGGMRQRAMIAMALSCHPALLIADEPTTALDVTTQAQILTLMRDLQQDLGMAILFITHDLGVIAQMTEHVIVMYLGKVVESASVDGIFYNPQHPYTQALLRSIPRLGERSKERLQAIRGSVPDPYTLPNGCLFHPRCPFSDGRRCVQEEPVLREIEPGHFASCHYAEQLDLPGIHTPIALAI